MDALEVLSLIRTMKNAFALINRTPPDILSLIPECCNHRQRDKEIIKLTHVCHGWRELFTSRPSLWNRLDCVDVHKTRVYLERSKSSPLEVSLKKDNEGNEKPGTSCRNDALLLVVPHMGRVKSLTALTLAENVLQDITTHFTCPVPLLENLSIVTRCLHAAILDPALFNGGLSSLRTLELEGVAGLPWSNLTNLVSFSLNRIPDGWISVATLLNFFVTAPLLRKISLICATPSLSDAPPELVISLPRLEEFIIGGPLRYSTLLNHLSIPPNTLMTMIFDLTSDQLPILDNHPKSLANLRHISHITQLSVSLRGKSKLIQLYGPSGRHNIQAKWVGEHGYENCPVTVNVRMLHSVIVFDTSKVQRLAVTQYAVSPQMNLGDSPPYHVLSRMDNLRTLTLTECHNILFFAALNPEKVSRGVILCPWLTDLTLHVHLEKRFSLAELWEMAKARDSRGVRLESVTVICTQQLVLPKEVFKLRQYVSQVQYKLEDGFPEWNVVVPDVDEEGVEDVKEE